MKKIKPKLAKLIENHFKNKKKELYSDIIKNEIDRLLNEEIPNYEYKRDVSELEEVSDDVSSQMPILTPGPRNATSPDIDNSADPRSEISAGLAGVKAHDVTMAESKNKLAKSKT